MSAPRAFATHPQRSRRRRWNTLAACGGVAPTSGIRIHCRLFGTHWSRRRRRSVAATRWWTDLCANEYRYHVSTVRTTKPGKVLGPPRQTTGYALIEVVTLGWSSGTGSARGRIAPTSRCWDACGGVAPTSGLNNWSACGGIAPTGTLSLNTPSADRQRTACGKRLS